VTHLMKKRRTNMSELDSQLKTDKQTGVAAVEGLGSQYRRPFQTEACLGYDGPTQMWIDGRLTYDDPDGSRIPMLPADVRAQWPTTRLTPDAVRIAFAADAGQHVIRLARGVLSDRDPGIFLRFRRVDMPAFDPQVRPVLPVVAKERDQ